MPFKTFAVNRILFYVVLVSVGPVFAQFNFVRHDISASVSGPFGLYAIDMDKDGKMDILLASTGGGAHWW